MRKFRVYPSRTSRKFYDVRIYKTQEQMQKATDLLHAAMGSTKVGQKRLAATYLNAPSPRLRNIGALYLYEGALEPYVIAHEIDHAVTMFIAEYEPKHRRLIYSDPEQDEFRASMVDWMHDQFWSLVQDQ